MRYLLITDNNELPGVSYGSRTYGVILLVHSVDTAVACLPAAAHGEGLGAAWVTSVMGMPACCASPSVARRTHPLSLWGYSLTPTA